MMVFTILLWVLKISVAIWLIVAIYSVLKYGLQRAILIIRWFTVVSCLGVFGVLTAFYLYPIAALFELVLPNNNPFWWWLDDEIEDSETNKDYLIFIENNSGKSTIYLNYRWHVFRNRIWNLNNLFKVPKGIEKVTEFVVDKLFRNDKKVVVGGKNVEMAALKYIGKAGQNPYNVNQGDIISRRYSTIGESGIWYDVDHWKSFRYSQAILVNYGIWKGWRTIKIGTNNKRYVMTLKHQKDKAWI